MKLTLSLLALTFSSLTFACPNFSGVYIFENDPEQIETTLAQHGCESLDISSPNQAMTIIIDGIFHQTINQDIIIQGQKMGAMQISHKAMFNNTDLLIDTKAHIETMGQVQDEETKTVNTLLPNGNFKSVATFKDGHQEISIAKRVR